MTGRGTPVPRPVASAGATSCAQGGTLLFTVAAGDGGPLRGHVVVTDVVAERDVFRVPVRGTHWTLDVPAAWPSSLYRAAFHDDRPEEPAPERDAEHEVWFAVRAERPGTDSRILVSVPFPTWRAYHRAGQAGRSIYYAEQPHRAARVRFTDPGGGPPPERWEEPLLRWLPRAGYRADICSALDLHDGDELLSAYRLLVVNGHDEYWSAGMRDTVENFVRRGGNLAVFAGNTAWWQIRLENGGTTMVCHRDAATDPMASLDPRLTTVEWSSHPVDRPENRMTGLSFRAGAGAWGEGMRVMGREAYTVRFADHWVFEGTGLRDGDSFARGALGYETDACELDWTAGVPRPSGRDGTPRSFAVLATADLRHWRTYGQGGWATLGVFSSGAGTVFNAATINWGRALSDPQVDRVTRNVLDRLSGLAPGPGWHSAGPAEGLRALAACEGLLFAVGADGSTLLRREPSDQNLPWTPCPTPPGPQPLLRCLAAPREASGAVPLALLAVDDDNRLLTREPTAAAAPWSAIGRVPAGTSALAMCDNTLFAVTGHDNTLHQCPAADPNGPWTVLGSAGKAGCLTVLDARLYAAGPDGLLERPPVVTDTAFRPVGAFPSVTALASYAGRLFAVSDDGRLTIHVPGVTGISPRGIVPPSG